VLRCVSFFDLADSLGCGGKEVYFESCDFDVDRPVELLPEVWDLLEGLQFLRRLDVHVRKIGTGLCKGLCLNDSFAHGYYLQVL
jgi:hypothetical protein